MKNDPNTAGIAIGHRAVAHQCKGQIPPLLANCAASVTGSTLFMHGGFDHFSDEVSDKVHLLDLSSWTWTEVEPCGDSPGKLCNHSATTLANGLVLVFGGEKTNGDFNRSIYTFDVSTRKWTDWQSPAPYGKVRHACCLNSEGDVAYFTGGSDGRAVLQYDLTERKWSEVPYVTERYDHRAAVINGKIWIVGGLMVSFLAKEEVQWYDLDSESLGVIKKGRTNPNICQPGMNVTGVAGDMFFNVNCSSGAITSKYVTLSVFDTATMAWKNDPKDPEEDMTDDDEDVRPDFRWFGGVHWDNKAVIWGCLVHEDDLENDPETGPVELYEKTSTHILVVDLNGIKGKAASPPTLASDLSGLLATTKYTDFSITGVEGSIRPPAESVKFSYHRKKKAKTWKSSMASSMCSITAHPPLTDSLPRSPQLASSDDTEHSSGESSVEPIPCFIVSKPVRVHSAILASRWPYFERLLDSGMSEAQTRLLHINEPIAWIRALVTYLYTDEIAESDRNYDTVSGLLVLAQIYCLSRLETLCVSFLSLPFYSTDEAVMVWERAYDSACMGVCSTVAAWCLKHRREVVQCDAFVNLAKEKVTLLLQQMFDQEENA